MVKKRMAMRMVTIFVALIVCGMFFPDRARGAGLSLNTELYVPLGKVEVGEQKITSVEITNESGSVLRIFPALDKDAACPEEDFIYTGLDIYSMEPDGTVTVKVTFKPSAVGTCSAWLTIMPIGDYPDGVESVKITFTGEGDEKSSRTFDKIVVGGVPTRVDDRMADADDSVGDMIRECEDTAYNHGHLVRCVGLLARELWREEIISRQDRLELSKAAIRAEMLKIMREIKTAKRSGRRGHNSKHWRWHHWPRLRHR